MLLDPNTYDGPSKYVYGKYSMLQKKNAIKVLNTLAIFIYDFKYRLCLFKPSISC